MLILQEKKGRYYLEKEFNFFRNETARKIKAFPELTIIEHDSESPPNDIKRLQRGDFLVLCNNEKKIIVTDVWRYHSEAMRRFTHIVVRQARDTAGEIDIEHRRIEIKHEKR